MSGGNRTDNGQSAYLGPVTVGAHQVWLTPPVGANTNQASGPVLDGFDDIYFGTGVVSNATMRGFSSLGGVLPGWPYIDPSNSGAARSTPCVGTDGTVYFGVGNGGALELQGIAAVNPNGTLRWNFDAPQAGSLVLADVASENGYVYVVVSNGTLGIHELYTLDATSGGLVNTVDVSPAAPGGWSAGGFAVASNGHVYYGGIDKLWCLNPDGSVLFTTGYTTQPNGLYYGSPVIAPDGTVYITDGGGIRSYIDTPGGFLPNFTFNGGYLGGIGYAAQTPAIRDLGGGAYYVFIDNGTSQHLDRVDQTASNLVSSVAVLGATVFNSPCLGSDGTVYLSTADPAATAIAINGNAPGPLPTTWSLGLGTAAVSGPALGSDGGLYVATSDGSLYKIHD
jgi:outer membrane protein assembly factor BamB